MIYPHHLEFMEEAKEAFESNLRFETYRNAEGNLIALRYGLDRNCIGIYEIGKEIGFFAEVMRSAPELVVSSVVRQEGESDAPFDVRAKMFARPNEWVGAFKDDRGRWHKVGFNTKIMSAQETELSGCDFEDDLMECSEDELNACIPLEDVPEEDRP